jgi:hypothetical protein
MERISAMVRQLAQQSGVNSQEAQKDERVTLLAAATLEMCRILERFSKTISAEMKKATEIELQNLDIQKQYAESVRISTVSVVRDIYYQFEEEQKKAFDKVAKYLSDTNDRMEKQIEVCTAQVHKATKNAVRSAERLRKLKTIGDILYFSAPILVLMDIIIRAVGLS